MGLQHATLLTYSSAIAFMHKLNYHCDPTNHFKVTKFLHGAKNLRPTKTKLHPINKNLLKLLVNAIPTLNTSQYNRTLLRAMMTLLYWGCLRIGEIATSNHSDHMLSLQQITIVNQSNHTPYLTINFKSYKHSTGTLPQLRVYSKQDKSICPVTALSSYLQLRPHTNSNALFLHLLGAPISRSFFAQHLRTLLSSTPHKGKKINTHSFRIGRATDLLMAGASDAKIQKMGRWSSNAYRKYLRPAVILV